MRLMGYNWAETKMKKLLLIALLFVFGSVIIGNTTDQQKGQNNSIETVKTAKEVEFWFEDEIIDGVVVNRTLVVRNYLSHSITWYGVIVENGEEETISKYVPANEKRMAYYGNGTLRVKKHWYEDSY